MQTINLDLAIVLGLGARLAVPLLITVLVALYLRRLDERWQSRCEQAESPVVKAECWKVKGCSPEARANCMGFLSPLSCWQARRMQSGYLREECLECKVFRKAYLPVLAHK